MSNQASNSIRKRAANVAADLATEHNDAPADIEKLLELCYLRAFTDGIQHALAAINRTCTEAPRV